MAAWFSLPWGKEEAGEGRVPLPGDELQLTVYFPHLTKKRMRSINST